MAKPMLVTVPPLLVAVGLLAAGAVRPGGRSPHGDGESATTELLATRAREAAAGGDRPGELCRNACHAPQEHDPGFADLVGSDRQCSGVVGHLSGSVLLSGRPGELLPLSGRRPSGLAGGRSHAYLGRHHRGGNRVAPAMPLPGGRLVLVFGNAGAGAGIGDRRGSRHGRPLHVFAQHRVFGGGGVGAGPGRRRLAAGAILAGRRGGGGDRHLDEPGGAANDLLARRADAVATRVGDDRG